MQGCWELHWPTESMLMKQSDAPGGSSLQLSSEGRPPQINIRGSCSSCWMGGFAGKQQPKAAGTTPAACALEPNQQPPAASAVAALPPMLVAAANNPDLLAGDVLQSQVPKVAGCHQVPDVYWRIRRGTFTIPDTPRRRVLLRPVAGVIQLKTLDEGRKLTSSCHTSSCHTSDMVSSGTGFLWKAGSTVSCALHYNAALRWQRQHRHACGSMSQTAVAAVAAAGMALQRCFAE